MNKNSTNSDYDTFWRQNNTHGTTENTIFMLHIANKGKHMSTVQKFHVQNLSKHNQHLDDNHNITKNPIFYTVITQN